MNDPHITNRVAQDYLSKFRKALRFMSKKNKNNILNEIESHLFDKAESLGELSDDNFHRATADFGPPKELAKHYKELYGYSKLFILGLIITGFIVALFSVPISVPGFNKDLIALNNVCLSLSTIFTLVIFIFIIYIGKEFGKWPGLYVGFACMFSRFVAVSILIGIIGAEAGEVSVTAGGGVGFLFGMVNIMMPIVGYLAGRTTFKFKKGFALEEKF